MPAFRLCRLVGVRSRQLCLPPAQGVHAPAPAPAAAEDGESLLPPLSQHLPILSCRGDTPGLQGQFLSSHQGRAWHWAVSHCPGLVASPSGTSGTHGHCSPSACLSSTVHSTHGCPRPCQHKHAQGAVLLLPGHNWALLPLKKQKNKQRGWGKRPFPLPAAPNPSSLLCHRGSLLCQGGEAARGPGGTQGQGLGCRWEHSRVWRGRVPHLQDSPPLHQPIDTGIRPARCSGKACGCPTLIFLP